MGEAALCSKADWAFVPRSKPASHATNPTRKIGSVCGNQSEWRVIPLNLIRPFMIIVAAGIAFKASL